MRGQSSRRPVVGPPQYGISDTDGWDAGTTWTCVGAKWTTDQVGRRHLEEGQPPRGGILWTETVGLTHNFEEEEQDTVRAELGVAILARLQVAVSEGTTYLTLPVRSNIPCTQTVHELSCIMSCTGQGRTRI